MFGEVLDTDDNNTRYRTTICTSLNLGIVELSLKAQANGIEVLCNP